MATNKTGSRGQLRTTLPTATTFNFSFESLIFPNLLRMQLSTEPPSSEGAMDGVQRLSRQHDNRKDNHGRNCNPHFMFRMGMCVEVRAFAKDPMQVFPAGRAVSAEGGMAVHRGDDT